MFMCLVFYTKKKHFLYLPISASVLSSKIVSYTDFSSLLKEFSWNLHYKGDKQVGHQM